MHSQRCAIGLTSSRASDPGRRRKRRRRRRRRRKVYSKLTQ